MSEVIRIAVQKFSELTSRTVIVLAIAGCDTAPTEVSTQRIVGDPSIPSSSQAIDVGVIFSEMESYLCLPLDRFKLPPDTSVSSIVSSCECVRPELVEYEAPRGLVSKGVLLRFIPEPQAHTSALQDRSPPQNLRVILKFALNNGALHESYVNMLHTSPARQEASK